MAKEATINARMSEPLKRSGTKVLEANGVSPTQLIRSLYAYLDREQRIPECLEAETSGKQQRVMRRRQIAHSIAGSITLPEGFDSKRAREERIVEKYGDLL